MRLLLLWLCTTLAWGQVDYDLLLKGGRVIDARNAIDGIRDVAVKDGRIAAVEASIDGGRAARVKQSEGGGKVA